MKRTAMWEALASIYGYAQLSIAAAYWWKPVVLPDGSLDRDRFTGKVNLVLVPGGVPQV